ncbi:MAG: Do family serine endopeptidase [Candidatus Poribacteria bacterium]|nr:Do family serine endopeptidase [Candidatus Poribacteria bacterium]
MLNFRHILGRRAAILLILAGLAVVAGLMINQGADKFVVPTAIGDTNVNPEELADFQALERANRAFINLVAKTRPSIVQITTISKRPVERRNSIRIFPNDEFNREDLRRWFGEEWYDRNFEEETPTDDPPRTIQTKQIGSGVIVSEEGYILTNNHVVDNAVKIAVTLPNGKEYDAELIGQDPGGTEVNGTDLAVLKIDAEKLSALPFGDSDALEVGEWVVAIGTPFNLSQTVTRGIVSAKNRASTRIQYSNFIQTDAPINQGNSGGALINIRGELVGINTLIATNGFTVGNVGIGFAIPSNTAAKLMPQLIEHGEIVRGWLGITMRSVSHDLAEKLDFDTPRGALVLEVGPGSPAEKSGIQHGDIILEFNKEAIQDSTHLQHAVGATPVGTSVQMKVLRNGKERELTVKLEERTEEVVASLRSGSTPEPLPMPPEELPETEEFAGMQVQKLTPELAKRYGYQNETGVIVMQVDADSQAAENGIQKGSLIKEIDYKPIENLKDYERIVKELKKVKEKLALVYVKDLNHRGNYFTLKIDPEKKNNPDDR